MTNSTSISSWQSQRLGEMAEEVRNLFEPRGGQEYPYIGLEHIEQGTLQLNGIGKSTGTVSTKKRFNAGEILFGSLRPYFRKVIRPKFNGVCSTDITVIKSKKNCNPCFLHYFLANQSFIDHATNISNGTKMPRANWNTLSQSEWRFPTLPTQHKIASILSNYDELIENNIRRIKILEEMAQSIYREWFVNYRFPGHEKVKMVDSSLGMIPEGWEVKTLGEIYNTSSGGTPSRKRPEYYINGTINWVKSQELTDKFILQTDEHITEKALDDSSAKIFPCNTVLIALYGATIGRLAILSQESATNQACCAILPKITPFGREFSFLTLLTNRERIINLRLGAAQQNISQILLRNLECLKPTETVVETFSSLTAPFFDGILNLQRQNVNLRQTRDLLLPRLISGELDVTDLDIQVPEEL